MNLLALLVVCPLLAAASCNSQRTPVPQDWSAKSPAEKDALLDKLADHCNLPHDTFRLEGDELYVKPHADEQYERLDCGLKALNSIRGLPKLGFVGNEYFSNEVQ